MTDGSHADNEGGIELAETWEQWKKTLAEAVQQGEQMGMSHQEIAGRAEQIGDLLAQQVEPQNPEQRVLQELWQSADEEEQEALASAIIRMVQH